MSSLLDDEVEVLSWLFLELACAICAEAGRLLGVGRAVFEVEFGGGGLGELSSGFILSRRLGVAIRLAALWFELLVVELEGEAEDDGDESEDEPVDDGFTIRLFVGPVADDVATAVPLMLLPVPFNGRGIVSYSCVV